MRNAWGCPVHAALSLAPEDARWNPTERSHYYESESIKNAVGTRDRVTYSNPSARLFVRPPRSRHLKRFWKLNEPSVGHVKYALRWRSRTVFTVLYRGFFDAPGTKYVSWFLPIQWGDHLTPHILPNTHYYHTQTLTYVKRISFLIIDQVESCVISNQSSLRKIYLRQHDQSKRIFFINIR